MSAVTFRPPPLLRCENCAAAMQELHFVGVTIDWCPECGSIYREDQSVWMVPAKSELALSADPKTRKAR